MKNSILIFLVLFFTFNYSFAQLIEPPPNSPAQEFYDYYMVKSKRNNTAGWICLGGGVGLLAIGAVVGMEGLFDLNGSEAGSGMGMMIVGSTGVIASIPLFINAGSYKRKARLSFEKAQNKVGSILFDNSTNFVVSLQIPLD